MSKSFVRPFKQLKIKIISNETSSILKLDEYIDTKNELPTDENQLIVKSPNELLHLSCAYGDLALICYAFALNADKNSILEHNNFCINETSANILGDKKSRMNGYTPLIKAVHSGSIVAVELLLLNGAKLNTCDFNGQTALHHATILKDLKYNFVFLEIEDSEAPEKVLDQDGSGAY